MGQVMPMRLVSSAVRYPFTLMASAVLAGTFVLPLSLHTYDAAMRTFDEVHPVVEMHGTLVRATAEEIFITIGGAKNRDCKYLRLQAYTADARGTLRDANIVRLDIAERGDTKPVGRYTIGTWRIWPRGDALRAVVFVNHLCGDRVVVTKIADVMI